MRTFITFLGLLLGCVSAMAHVGSPNVFFEGWARAHNVSVVIRPPAALPGVAQVSVKIAGAEVQGVSLQSVALSAGRDHAPAPTEAKRITGESNVWSGELWLLRPGLYTVGITIVTASDRAEVSVPFMAAGLSRQPMPNSLRWQLGLLGVFLISFAVAMAFAFARDGGNSARLWAGGVGLAMLMATVAGAARWRNLDTTYQARGIVKPEPVQAFVLVETNRTVLAVRPAPDAPPASSWATLLPDHGKLMHLFLLREPELDVFAHLHPIRRTEREFVLELPQLPAGDYQLYGDVAFENGLSQTLVAQIRLPEPQGPFREMPALTTNAVGEIVCGSFGSALTNGDMTLPDTDDAWHIQSNAPKQTGPANRPGMVARLMGGYSLLFENARAVAEGREASLRFAAFTPDGTEASLQNYMGMAGHAVVRRQDGAVFAHLHPSGSFSMATWDMLRRRDGMLADAADQDTPRHRVTFPYEFPKPGDYRVWVQVRIAGRVLTGVYDLVIGPVTGR